MTNKEQYIRAIKEEIDRDLSMMSIDYQKGHKNAMEHALNLFNVWFFATGIDKHLKENEK